MELCSWLISFEYANIFLKAVDKSVGNLLLNTAHCLKLILVQRQMGSTSMMCRGKVLVFEFVFR